MTFIIKEHRPGRWRIVVVVAILLWLFSVWLMHQYGWDQAIDKFDYEFERNKSLQEKLSSATAANREMHAKIAILERTAQVDREAKVELARNIKLLQGKVAKLREDVSFYKSIVSPEKGHAGIGVYSFKVMDAGENLYHFKMVLTQAGKSASLAEGSVGITIAGILNGQEKHLRLSEIQVSKRKGLSYKFHYFEELGGSLRFPQGFSPRVVTIKLKRRKGSKIKNPVKQLDWINVRA